MSNFLWGVSTSAYQSEGGYNGPGQPQTNWAKAEANGDVMISGKSADFWSMYADDFARCREMGLNAFRLGIEWSRVQPGAIGQNTEVTPPPFDFQAFDHYVAMLVACRQAGLEPVVTLHHFVHPAWLGPDPWLSPSVLVHFTAYVTTAISYLNNALVQRHGMAPLRYYITVNEPNMLALNTYLGTQFPGEARCGVPTVNHCYNQLLSAHVLAYNIIHDHYEQHGWSKPMVTVNNCCNDLYWSDKFLLDFLNLRELAIPRHAVGDYIERKAAEFKTAFHSARIPLHRDPSCYFGALMKRLGNWAGHHFFRKADFTVLLDTIYSSSRVRLFDFLGLDYYDPFMAHAFRLPMIWDREFKSKTFRSWVMDSISSKWWDWRVLPRGLHFFCEYYSRDFGNRPILIAENGMAQRRRPDNTHSKRRDRFTRSNFLRLHINEVINISNEGLPLLGYMHWSLFDNYEWGSFTPRFGLYSLDYTRGPERLVEDHFGDRPSETYASLIREAREKMKEGACAGCRQK